MSRKTELLRFAAERLEALDDPFHHSNLVAKNITLDECGDLAEGLAVIIKGYLAADRDTQDLILLLGVTDGTIPADIVRSTVGLQQTTRKLAERRVRGGSADV